MRARQGRREAPVVGALAVVGWGACGGTMFLGMALAPLGVALAVHAAAAPVIFVLLSVLYFRRRGAWPPLRVATAFVGTVILLDLVVVSMLIEGSFAMFGSFVGTWLPFGLIFFATIVTGLAMRARRTTKAPPGPARRAIAEFLEKRRIAFVGLSTDPKAFSRTIYAEMVTRGYDIVPVHPGVQAIDGRRAYARVQDVPGTVEAALVMTPSASSAEVVRDCIEADVRHVWLHRGAGPGAVSEEALALCRSKGLHVVPGQCPMMFLSETSPGHRAHGYLKILAGTYPA